MEYLSLIPAVIGLAGSALNVLGGVVHNLPTPSKEHVKPSYHKEKLSQANHHRKHVKRHVTRKFHLSADVETESK